MAAACCCLLAPSVYTEPKTSPLWSNSATKKPKNSTSPSFHYEDDEHRSLEVTLQSFLDLIRSVDNSGDLYPSSSQWNHKSEKKSSKRNEESPSTTEAQKNDSNAIGTETAAPKTNDDSETISNDDEAKKKEARRQKVLAMREEARRKAAERGRVAAGKEEERDDDRQARRKKSREAFQERLKEAEELEKRRRAEREKCQQQQSQQQYNTQQWHAPATASYGYSSPQTGSWHGASFLRQRHQQQQWQQDSTPCSVSDSFSQAPRSHPMPQEPLHHASSSFQQQQQQQQPHRSPPPAASLQPLTGSESTTVQDRTIEIKQSISIEWAHQPPSFRDLRPIDVLLQTLHLVLPPAFGVKTHMYFDKWTPISSKDLISSSCIDDGKVKRAVRKVRFFLHPDKLPLDFTEEQQLVCRIVWDTISEAWESHKSSS